MTASRRAPPVALVLAPPIDPADAASMCERACAADQPIGRADRLVVDVGALPGTDLATVDLLARCAVAARRSGRRLELRAAPAELRELVALAGLERILRSDATLSRGAAAGRRAGRTAACRGRT